MLRKNNVEVVEQTLKALQEQIADAKMCKETHEQHDATNSEGSSPFREYTISRKHECYNAIIKPTPIHSREKLTQHRPINTTSVYHKLNSRPNLTTSSTTGEDKTAKSTYAGVNHFSISATSAFSKVIPTTKTEICSCG